jgi:hypothetical protein
MFRMTQSSDEAPAYLEDEEAISWYVRRKGRDVAFDAHVSAIRELFGGDVRINVRAATDPRNGAPRTLLIEVTTGALDDEEAWAKIVSVQEYLIERRSTLAEARRIKDPFRDIVVTMSPTEEQWNMVNREYEDV